MPPKIGVFLQSQLINLQAVLVAHLIMDGQELQLCFSRSLQDVLAAA